jgi:anhydro-N-acetylmuramic acid kinase
MKIISLMSGTSLDGVDLAYCNFENLESNNWDFKLEFAKTYKYDTETFKKLNEVIHYNSFDYLEFDNQLGLLYGDLINQFIEEFEIEKNEISLIASHGHTVHHQPQKMVTSQIGHGTAIAIKTGIRVVNDFRIKDVLLGGQGAPLVPIGDSLLFSNLAEGFLNIGGFSNISFKKENKIFAFDICPGNLPSNHYVKEKNISFDKNGEIASKGIVNEELLLKLNKLNFYAQSFPKSLGIEWLNQYFYPIIDEEIITLEDKLATINEHISHQISKITTTNNIHKLLITGGGAYNGDLIDRIQKNSNSEIIIPSPEIIEFKEAIIFGLLGALYIEKQVNTLASVTGSNRDSIGGILHLPY